MPASYARIVLTAATAAVASLLLSPSSAAAAAQVSFEATLNGSTLLPFPHYWEECVGSGHMALGLRSDWQAHLKKVKDACGFRRIRGHGLLDNDMNIILPNDGTFDATSAGPPATPDIKGKGTHYSFRNADLVYDYLLSIDMKPVVALSWLPSQLAAPGNDCGTWHYRGCSGPPANITDFGALVGALAAHFVERHGVEEVRQWPWELWNEPNCGPCESTGNNTGWTTDGIFPACPAGHARNPSYPGCGPGGFNLSTYLEVFDETSKRLKGVDAQLPVGGPASQQLGWVKELKEHAEKTGVALDFISTHQYPSDNQVPKNLEGHSEAITQAAAAAGEKYPLFLTEYAIGNHDSVTAAAGILSYVPRLSGVLPLMSYWAFSDVFEEHGIEAVPFHNEWGLVNIYGNPKPAFRAFEMLHEAGDMAAPITAQDGDPVHSPVYATKMMDAANQSAVTAFVTVQENSMKTARQVKAYITSYNTSDDSGNAPQPNAVSVSVSFCGAGPNPPTTARLRRIDNTHANPRALWAGPELNKTVYPTDAQIAQMEAASQLVDESVSLTPSASGGGGGGCVVATVAMPEVAVAVIDFDLSM